MTIEEEIDRLYAGSKTFAVPPSWHFEGESRNRLEMRVPLSIDYVTEEGLFLYGSCYPHVKDGGVTFVLLYHPAQGLAGPIVRFCWNPLHDHKNFGGHKGEWAWKPIVTTHLHGFELNRKYGWDGMVRKNLPIALPVDEELSDFRDMLEYVGKIFKIADIQRVPVPEWQQTLI
jgi:hypothetical protein